MTHVMFAGLGGHGSVVFSLVRASEADVAHRIVFVGTGDLLGTYAVDCERLGIPFTHLRTSGGPDLRFHRAVVRELVANPADVILVHSSGSLPSALLAKVRRPRTQVVVVEHQAWDLRTRRHRWATYLGLAVADHVVVLNEGFRRRLEDAHPRLTRRARISVIPNGIDVDRFTPPKTVRVDHPGGPVRIGMQARMTVLKDHETLVRALPLLGQQLGREVRLELAGDGDTRPALEAIVRELDLRESVRFLGTLPEEDLVPFLQALDVYVHASLGEAMSTALLQAMATARPVVASAVAGIADLLEGHDVAVLVPPQDPAGYADAVASLLKDDARRARLGAAARAFVERDFSSPAMWSRYRSMVRPTREPATSPLLDLVDRAGPATRPSPDGAIEAPPGTMCIWPSAEHPRVAWPEVSDHVGRWFQRTGILGGGSSTTVRWAARQPALWPLVRRRAASVSVPGHHHAADVDRDLRTLIADRSTSWLGRQIDPGDLCLGFIARKVVTPPRGVVVAFVGDESVPAAVVKMSLDPTGHHMLQNEFTALERLWSIAPPPATARFPRPLGFELWTDHALAVFSYLPGTLLVGPPLEVRTARSTRRLQRYWQAVGVISQELSGLQPHIGLANSTSLSEIVDRFAYEVERTGGGDHPRVRGFGRAVAESGFSWRPGWQHGDLAHGNVLFHWESPRAVDWEMADDAYPPWFDESYALLAMLLEVDAHANRFDRLSAQQQPGRLLEQMVAGGWSHDLPVGWALALTAMQVTLRSLDLGRGGHGRWQTLALTLVDDEDVRLRASWLVPQW